MARPLIPIDQKIAEGKLNKAQAKKPSLSQTTWPPVPAHYKRIHKQVFLSVCEALDRMNQLDEMDSFIIQMFTDAWVLRQQTLAVIERNGVSYTAAINGIAMHRMRPEFLAYKEFDAKILKYMAKMGLSPADRTQLNMVLDETKLGADVVEGQLVNEFQADLLDDFK